MSDPESRSVLTVIREIRSGATAPGNLSIDERRSCVAHLSGDGYSATEIAEILKTSERTINRDRRAIQAANAVEHDPKLASEMVGRLIGEAELCISRIRRALRDREATAQVKVDGERKCFQITVDMITALQRLGYLPMASLDVRADVTHRLGVPDMEAVRAEFERLKSITASCGLPSDELDEEIIEKMLTQEPRKEAEVESATEPESGSGSE